MREETSAAVKSAAGPSGDGPGDSGGQTGKMHVASSNRNSNNRPGGGDDRGGGAGGARNEVHLIRTCVFRIPSLSHLYTVPDHRWASSVADDAHDVGS